MKDAREKHEENSTDGMTVIRKHKQEFNTKTDVAMASYACLIPGVLLLQERVDSCTQRLQRPEAIPRPKCHRRSHFTSAIQRQATLARRSDSSESSWTSTTTLTCHFELDPEVARGCSGGRDVGVVVAVHKKVDQHIPKLTLQAARPAEAALVPVILIGRAGAP